MTIISPSNIAESQSLGAGAKFIAILAKLGFYNKIGVVLWSFLAFLLQGYEVWQRLEEGVSDAISAINLAMFFNVLSILAFIPVTIYLIERNASISFEGETLRAPNHKLILFLPFLLKTGITTSGIIMRAQDHNQEQFRQTT